jgi:hypothetical protein
VHADGSTLLRRVQEELTVDLPPEQALPEEMDELPAEDMTEADMDQAAQDRAQADVDAEDFIRIGSGGQQVSLSLSKGGELGYSRSLSIDPSPR